MATVQITWADDTLKKFGKEIAEINRRFPKAIPQTINQVGDRTKTQVIRSLTKQTGLPRRTIAKAVGDPMRAHPGRLSYTMVTKGGQVRLKYLAPRETRGGVSAKPWGKRTVFPGTFMMAGKFPNRLKVDAFGGHVWRRLGHGQRRDGTIGWKLTQVRSGMSIPAEMTTGATRGVFERTAGILLKQRVEALIGKLLK